MNNKDIKLILKMLSLYNGEFVMNDNERKVYEKLKLKIGDINANE